MIVGTGIDLVRVARVAGVYEKHGGRFVSHVLHEKELAEFEKAPDKARFLAKRFAVKEAATKALGTGQAQGVLLRHFYVIHNKHGKPLLHADSAAKKICTNIGAMAMHVSISDESEYAIANVILEKLS